MTLEQLEVDMAVVDCGSFRAAAEKLYRSQPALSAAVKNLEEEFDMQIFDRSEYRPKLTEAGAVFVNIAKSTLASSQYVARVARELGNKKAETKLRVAVDPLASIEAVEVLALECSRPTYPATLILEKSILRSSDQRLIDGKIDLAIGPTDSSTGKIEAIHLETVTMVGAVSRKLLQEKKKATKEFIEAHPQIFAYDVNQDEEPDHVPESMMRGNHQKIFAPDHATKLKLISSGLGWGRLSKQEIAENKDLVAIDKSVLSHFVLDICLTRSRDRALGPIARTIWQIFEKRAAANFN